MKKPKIQKKPISQVQIDPNNPRSLSKDKFRKLKESIKNFPEMLEVRPLVVADGYVIGGNMRLLAMKDLGYREVSIIDVTEWNQKQRDEFMIKDNLSYGDWDWDILANEWNTVDLDDWGFDVWPNPDDVNEEEEEIYSHNIEAPTYEPKNKKPNVDDLFSDDKVKELIKKIGHSNITSAEKTFLTKAAYRHTVFNYQSVADFYAHSNKEVQDLMEESALVIIDFNKAIENGYVKLTKEVQELYEDEYED